MKRINIKSLLQAKDSFKQDDYRSFLRHYGVEVRDSEIEDLRSLIEELCSAKCGMVDLDRFYFGYKIPQIGKEFDLLRFGENHIINIELKRKSTEEKVRNQLLRNKYYLGFIDRKIYEFTYISESRELYVLDDNEEVRKCNIEYLLEVLKNQKIKDSEVPDSLFDPSDYLVSPFNSTDRFLAKKYFLTKQQEEIKAQILDALSGPAEFSFLSITGSAGTGKTLLTYDIAGHMMDCQKKILLIHCGQLNQGHRILIDHGWNIIPVKAITGADVGKYDLIVIDESQRIRPSHFDLIVDKMQSEKCSCIFSYDKGQTLSESEEKADISSKIAAISSPNQYRLSERIRTNKEISEFMKMLFDRRRSIPCRDQGNININYFNNISDAKSYLKSLSQEIWEILRFTPSQYNKEHHENYFEDVCKTSHQIIGQEFEGVVVVIDKFFSYREDGNLVYVGGSYYDVSKMLFQNITRSRKRLNIVIVENEQLLNRCFEILK